MSKETRSGLTVRQAGEKGGNRVREKYGPDFYAEIGRLGGQRGGSIGGKTVREKYGSDFYSRIGKKGGQKIRDMIQKGKEVETK